MATLIDPPQMSEPQVVDCHFVEGVYLEVRDDVVRIVGWIDLETAAEGAERRIVVRAAMPTIVARALIRDLRRAVARGGN
jgi:hypothetical protein